MAVYGQTHGPGRLAWSESGQPTGAELHSSDEPSELLKWLSHDNNTINIVLRIIITTTTTTTMSSSFVIIYVLSSSKWVSD